MWIAAVVQYILRLRYIAGFSDPIDEVPEVQVVRQNAIEALPRDDLMHLRQHSCVILSALSTDGHRTLNAANNVARPILALCKP